MSGVVLIPAYKPDDVLIRLVGELRENQFKIVVVDDGSGTDYATVFEAVSLYATVVTHSKNRGKGAALKTGISYISQHFNDCKYFITADADGQHLVSDILRVRDKLEKGAQVVLTTRVLKGKIPLRSRFGNFLSRVIFTMLTGKFFIDNQSGLRGFTMEQCPWLLKVDGEFYDYEMNVLYHAEKQLITISTLDVRAVYIDGNKSSHFNPVQDTLRIYKRLFHSARGTFISIALTEILLIISVLSINLKYLFVTLPTIGIITVAFNIFFSIAISMREFKFRDTGRMLARMAIRYSLYILLAWLSSMWWPELTVFISFHVIALLVAVPEYLMIKFFSLLANRIRRVKEA